MYILMALNFMEQIKKMWFLFLGGGALNLTMVYLKWARGPLTTWWTIGGIASLGIGIWGFMASGGLNALNQTVGAKANYAYPNFYPYGHPFYYHHLMSPDVANNYGSGYVDVPRISNALAAKPIVTGNYQHTSGNPQYDSNHIYSYIQEEY